MCYIHGVYKCKHWLMCTIVYSVHMCVHFPFQSSESNFLFQISKMRNGNMERRFVWVKGEKRIKFSFFRILSMDTPHIAYQRVSITSDAPAKLKVRFYLDGTILHWGKHCFWEKGKAAEDELYLLTPTTNQSLYTLQQIVSEEKKSLVTVLDNEIYNYNTI